jgi:YVTN family beta-propeller protein
VVTKKMGSWHARSLVAVLCVLAALGMALQAGGAVAQAANSADCDSWAAPVSGSWNDPAMWTSGVPEGSACITVAGTYSVTKPAGDVILSTVVLGDGSGAGQESLVFAGCGTSRDRLFISDSLTVSPGGIIDLQGAKTCEGTAAVGSGIEGLTNSTLTLGGTVLAEEQTGGVPLSLTASAITNTGTIIADAGISINSIDPSMTFDNRGVITGSESFGLNMPPTGAALTNEGSIQGGVTFLFPAAGGGLSTTAGSTFANNAGGDIASRGTVLMGTGTTFIQDAGTMSAGIAELPDGSSLDLTGAGSATFFAGDGTVSMTGDVHPGQTLNVQAEECPPPGNIADATLNAAGSFTNSGTINLEESGPSACAAANSTLTVPAGDVITNRGTIETEPGRSPGGGRTIFGGVANAGGTIRVDSGTHLAISAGSVDNAGTVQLSGPLAVSGDYTQEPAGTTSIAVGSHFGTASVQATGTASLAGALDLSGDGVTPPAGSSAALISAGPVTGTFGTVTGSDAGGGLEYQLGYSSSAVTATVAAPAPVLTGIAVSPAHPFLAAGSSTQLTATGTYSDGSAKDISGTATWSSSNPAVAAVSASGLVTAVAPGTTTITAALAGLSATASVTVTARRTAYVASLSGHLTVIDRSTNAVLTTVAVGGLPDSAAVSPDGSKVYVADATGRLQVLDAATDKVSAIVKVGGAPDSVAVSPDGSKVYVADATGRLEVVDAAAGTVSSTLGVGGIPDSVAVSPDGSKVYVADAAGRLDVIDTATGKVSAAAQMGGAPDSVAVSPDGSKVYVAGAAGQLTVINAATSAVAAKVTVGGLPDAVAVSPDGSTVYLAGAAGRLATISAGPDQVTATLNVGGAPDSVAVSPDGSTVYVAGAASKTMTVINAATGQIQATVPVGRGAIALALS